jgi:hypothetical protein
MNKEGWSDYIHNGDLDGKPDFDDALTISWWLNLNININELLPTLKEFGELQEWSAKAIGLRRFGDTETNDISVCFDNETHNIEEVSCRIDLRKVNKGFIDKALALAARFDCLLMDKQGKLYEPTIKNLLDTIQSFNAGRFVENPKQFLDDLSKGIVTPE